MRRGAIHVANFNPPKGTEPSKIRPCLVMQCDPLNDAGHPSTTVLPLTARLIDDAVPLRYRLAARGALRQDSDVMLDQTRTIDNRRIDPQPIADVSASEMQAIEVLWRIVLGLD